MGDTMVPETSPVTDAKYWRTTGALLALALLSGENLHPVSPVVVYALLANVHKRPEAVASMDLSLSFIEQLEGSKATTLLPWMIIPPRKDWRELPPGHRAQLFQIVMGFDIDVGQTTVLISYHTHTPPFSLPPCQLNLQQSTQNGLQF